MNAIISLCHFCEQHGPSVVFSTQAYRDAPSITDNIIPSIDHQSTLKSTESVWKYGNLSKENKLDLNIETCSACCSFQHNKPGYVSNDDSARVTYISSQYPLNTELANLTRQASTRSLSCEVCSGKEGPIYFGDDVRGHVISYTFSLRDSQARGFQRWYSIIVLMKDKMFLLNSWTFLIRHIQQTIEGLRTESSEVYGREGGNVAKHSSVKAASSDGMKRLREIGPPRSLVELVGSTNVWQQLHKSFTWVLKAGALRLQERLVEGPPLSTTCSFSEDGLSLRQLVEGISEGTFRRLLHHLFIGHKIFIKGSNEGLVSSVVDTLKVLLPQWCYKELNYTKEVCDFSSYNIIGTSLNVQVEQQDKNCTLTFMQKDEEELKLEEKFKQLELQSQKLNSRSDQLFVILNKHLVDLSENENLYPRPPQIVTKINNAIHNLSLSDSALHIFITSLVEEWSNKVKIWKFLKSQNISNTTGLSAEHCNISNILNPREMFNTSPLNVSSSSQTQGQLLMTVGINEFDVPLLEYWSLKYNS